ncbi:hypothetical protein LCGC14_1731170 [marine sediment metagenome]|uniref:Uncharacterized protein n=1 Tax=marine sediment metagenome TaxID=412755 RepID=A0A0F9HX85_9ZZZZ
MRSYIATLFLVLFLPSCALTWHTAPRYRYDAGAAAELQGRAEAWCTEQGHPAGVPIRPFYTDGCTHWWDGYLTNQWQEACVSHDIAYWCGGSAELRRKADGRLRDDVGGLMGKIMWIGVRPLGHPSLPAGRSHWGFGTGYKLGYPEE